MDDKPRSKSDYLEALFAKGGMDEAHEVLTLRGRFLHAEAPRAQEVIEDSGPGREQIGAELNAIVDSFYDTDQDRLFQQLGDLSCESFPDLERFKKRLKRVVSQLATIEDADQDQALDNRLWNMFKSLLIAPHQQATGLKRKISQSISRQAAQKRAAKFAKRVKRHYPELYSLEKDWLSQLVIGKKVAKESRRPKSVGLGCLGIYSIFYIVTRVIRVIWGND